MITPEFFWWSILFLHNFAFQSPLLELRHASIVCTPQNPEPLLYPQALTVAGQFPWIQGHYRLP